MRGIEKSQKYLVWKELGSNGRQINSYCYSQSRQMQTKEMSARMQEILSSGENGYKYTVIIHSYYSGKLCIEVAPTSKLAFISEELCIGCGICVKVQNTF